MSRSVSTKSSFPLFDYSRHPPPRSLLTEELKLSQLPSFVCIVEVGFCDGLQNERLTVPTAVKTSYASDWIVAACR